MWFLDRTNFWAILNDITKIEPDKAKGISSKIYQRYLEDIEHISDDLVGIKENKEQNQHLSRGSLQDNQVSQQIQISQTSSLGQLIVPSMGTIQINDNDTLTIARTYLDVLEKKMKEPKTESKKVESSNDESEFEQHIDDP